MQTVLKDNHIRGALTSLLGPSYSLHPHRHVHETFPGKETQPLHQDTYFDYFQRHQHVPQWAMVFYYPQDTTLELGPTNIVNGSQYDNSQRPADSKRMPLLVKAGDFVVVHYNIWHGAGANLLGKRIPGTQWRNSKDLVFMKRKNSFPDDPELYRYMIKLQFIRLQQPGLNGPSWNFQPLNLAQTAMIDKQINIDQDTNKLSSTNQLATPATIEIDEEKMLASCNQPCIVDDPDGLSDGICDEQANLCRCNWDGGDCAIAVEAAVRKKDIRRLYKNGNEYTENNDISSEKTNASLDCNIDYLVHQGGALRSHLFQWMSGGALSIDSVGPDVTPCDSVQQCATTLSNNIESLSTVLNNRARVSMIFTLRLFYNFVSADNSWILCSSCFYFNFWDVFCYN